jgi:two-component sensor histidine kinase
MRLSESNPWRSRWLRWAAVVVVATLLGLCEAVQCHFSYAAKKDPISWHQAFGLGLGLWYGWAVIWFGAYELVRRLPLEQHNWLPRLLIHATVGLSLPLAKFVLDYPVILSFYCKDPESLTFPKFYGMAMGGHYYQYLLISWAMLGVGHALRSYSKYWERTLVSARLETQLARAQLQVLKMQLHPHFLFNTLNTISALIHSDGERADQMVARLGDLLRQTLEHSGGEEVPLRRELDFVESYLEIDRIRFGSRLSVQVDVDPEALGATLPCLLLQPLVENAIRHGIDQKAGPGRLAIRARRAGRWLRLQVEDNGPGLPPDVEEGIGLSNTRARLRQLYGDAHAFVLQGGAATGTCVTVEVPFRTADEADGEEIAAETVVVS